MEEHILVGLSSAPSNARIIRTAATMAQAFDCTFTALFVRTPGFDAMSDADKERLRSNTRLAEELGATVETVFGDDVSYQIAEYARLSGVTKIVVGRSAATRKHPWSKPTLTEKLTAIAPDLDIHIIPDASVDASYRPKQARKKLDAKTVFRELGIAVGVFFPAALAGLGFYRLGYPGVILIILLAVLIIGTMAGKMKNHTRQSTQAAYRTNLLLETNQLLQKAATDEAVFQVAKTQAVKLLNRDCVVYPGIGQAREDSLCCQIRLRSVVYGTVVIDGAEPLEAFENSVLLSILGECALALENSRNEKEKEDAKLQAEHEKLRANLLRSISHDLRTPLTAISGNASILLSGSNLDAQTRQQMYADIYDDSVWLHNLVENLLAVTKIEEGRMELRTQPQLVEEIVSEAMQHISRRKTEHTITVSHEDDLLLAKCDARLIIQVIINLVDNAIKYTPAGSHIAVTTRSEQGMAVISVADNGQGIPDSEKEYVFQMFYTGRSAVADSRRSLGLGLSLCKSIVDTHGGEIRVRDNQPSGAVFTFTIPTGEVEVHE